MQHTGSSVNPQRQSHAFAHSIRVDPTNRFVLVADLGLDKLFVYKFNVKDGSLTPNDPPFVKAAPGSGPRHVVFHPNGRWVYLITEMGSTIMLFNWDTQRGALSEVETVSTLPKDFQGKSACAEMQVHPSGKFVYASNRGRDSIAVFSVDAKTGRLTLIQDVPSGGKTPRNFDMDPTRALVAGDESRQQHRDGVPHRPADRKADAGRAAGGRAVPVLPAVPGAVIGAKDRGPAASPAPRRNTMSF